MEPARHHRYLISHLQALADGEFDRLLVMMPPGSAKTFYGSILFPAWFLARRPGALVVAASHSGDLAETFSAKTQGFVRDHSATLGYGLTKDSVRHWETTNGGSYKTIGAGAGFSGRRADLVGIDDPFGSREDAESPASRDKIWNWYNADVIPRVRPGGIILVIMTHWHEDDLAGRLVERMAGEWRVIKISATAGADDPIGREPGELLWSDGDYGYADVLRKVRETYEANGSMRDWYSLYEQDPRPAGGGLFVTTKMVPIDTAEPGTYVRGWDLAATAQFGSGNPDWTVGVLMGRTKAGRIVVADVKRFRGPPEMVEKTVVDTATADGARVTVSLPQDPGQAGKAQILYLTRRLAGFTVRSSPETGHKSTRAMPFASQMNAGNVALVRGRWNAAYVDELSGFPGATKDDQVDASSRAFNTLVRPPAPARGVRLPLLGR